MRYPGLFAPQFSRKSGPNRKTSLVNLIEAARHEESLWQRSARGQVIWIVCDVDQNEVHQQLLCDWVNEATNHRSALQSLALENWLLQHQKKPSRPSSASAALKALTRQWPSYSKGCVIPPWVINNTDQACQRERQRVGPDGDGYWPKPGSSQLYRLIDYLDERAHRLRSPQVRT